MLTGKAWECLQVKQLCKYKFHYQCQSFLFFSKIAIPKTRVSRKSVPKISCIEAERNRQLEEIGRKSFCWDCVYQSVNGKISSILFKFHKDIFGKKANIYFLKRTIFEAPVIDCSYLQSAQDKETADCLSSSSVNSLFSNTYTSSGFWRTHCGSNGLFMSQLNRFLGSYTHKKYNEHYSSRLVSFVNIRPYSQSLDADRKFNGKDLIKQSALYVSHKDHFNTTTVFADLNLEARFQNLNKLHENVVTRGMDINVFELFQKYKELQDIRNQVKKMEAKKQEVVDRISKLRVKEKETSVESTEKFQRLRYRVREIKEELKPITELANTLEEEVTLEALRLPTDLHPSTPEDSVILEELGEKPDFSFPPKDHVILAEKTGTVVFSTISPGAYYLTGKLSRLHYTLECTLDDVLQEAGLTPMVCPDMVKSVVLEGSGSDIMDPQTVFTIQKKPQETQEEEEHGLVKLDNTYHLTGVSPTAFNAYLTRVNVTEKCLPLKYFSVGNKFTPSSLYSCQQHPSLLASPQATVAELFGAARNPEEIDAIYEEYVSIMKDFYTRLNLPVRFVKVRASDLYKMEAARQDAEIWMSSLKSYVKVGAVSLWNDYASRRLMMKFSEKGADSANRNYIHTVHGTLVNLNVLIAAVMENTQNQVGDFDMPEALLKRLELEGSNTSQTSEHLQKKTADKSIPRVWQDEIL